MIETILPNGAAERKTNLLGEPLQPCPQCGDLCGALVKGVCLECFLIAEEEASYNSPFADPDLGPEHAARQAELNARLEAEQAKRDEQARHIAQDFERRLRQWQQEQEEEEAAEARAEWEAERVEEYERREADEYWGSAEMSCSLCGID